MRRRDFLTAITATASGGVLIPQVNGGQENKSQPLVSTPLVLMAPRSDGFEAVWGVTRLSKGKLIVEEGGTVVSEYTTDSFGFVPQGDRVLRVRVEGLTPGKTYQVKAVTTAAADGEEHISPKKIFRALNPRSAATEFVVWNDTHINNPTIAELHKVSPSGDFLVWNGDTCNDWTSPDLLIPTLLNPGQQDITANRPLFLIWGNHDVRGQHAFEMPQMVATPTGRPFYAFRSGPVAAICLHTGEDKPDSHPSFRGRVSFDTLREEQARWLGNIIQQPDFRDAPYRVVFCHIPLRWPDETMPDYAKGGFDRVSLRSRELWHEPLVKWRAQLIISGHTHQPGWFPPDEKFPYGQLIGGGPQRKSATWMLGKADSKSAVIAVRDLDGVLKHEVTLGPLT
jgi:predicted phosphodiesterase